VPAKSEEWLKEAGSMGCRSAQPVKQIKPKDYMGLGDYAYAELPPIVPLSAWTGTVAPHTNYTLPPNVGHSEVMWASNNCARFRAIRFSDSDPTRCATATPDHIDPKAAQAPCFTHALRDMLRVLTQTFDQHKIEYLAGFGSLLGAMREQQIIPWTTDVDVLLSAENLRLLAQNVNGVLDDLRAKGVSFFSDRDYFRYCLNTNYAGNLELSHMDPAHDAATLYVHTWTPGGDAFYLDTSDERTVKVGKKCRFDVDVFEPSQRIPLYPGTASELMISVPNDPATILSMFYKDWETPPLKKKGHGAPSCFG
jgi:hypothetical protein